MRGITSEAMVDIRASLAPLEVAGWVFTWCRNKAWAPHLWCLQAKRGMVMIPFFGNNLSSVVIDAVAGLESRSSALEDDDGFEIGEEEPGG